MENSSVESDDYRVIFKGVAPPDINIFFAIFIPTLMLLIIGCNLATIIAFWKERSLREKPSDLLILGLSTADLGDGVHLFLLAPAYITGLWPFGEFGCRILLFTGGIFIFVSLLILMCISIDRLLLVSLHYSVYLKFQTKARVRITLLACWIIGGIPAIVEMVIWDIAKRIEPAAKFINFENVCLSPPRRIDAFASVVFVVFVFMPVIIVLCLSVAFLIFLRRRLRKRAQIGNTIAAERSRSTQNNNHRSEHGESSTRSETDHSHFKSRYLKPSLTLISLVIAMTICMVPYCLYIIGINIFCSECLDHNVVLQLALLIHLNPLFNPLLYAATQSKIRHFYRIKIKNVFKI